MPHRTVIYIHFKAWDTLESKFVSLIKRLLTDYELILMGFELDFDYDDENLQLAIDKLKANRFNYPFILKYFNDCEPIVFCDKDVLRERELLDLLKVKTHPVFELIN